MKLPSRLDPHPHLGFVLVGLGALFVACCQTQTVVLSPPMHTRIVDGTTGKPIDRVRVMLVSHDAAPAMAYSNRLGFVDMPGLVGQHSTAFRLTADTPRAAVHAVFERPGYQPYTIDSVNGYGFFKGYRDVHLFPE
jgi:hypothetical protein